jgi:transcriptional regulator with XRE-family HTH domain
MSTGAGFDLAIRVGLAIRDGRRMLGWSQQELGDRAAVTQSAISRLERGLPAGIDLEDLARTAAAMGGEFHLEFRAPFLEDRRRQRDRVHARSVAYVLARLRRAGWVTASEVEIGGGAGLGWIDLLAFGPATGTLLVIEVKTEIHDFGRIQRTLSWYESRAREAARRLGWQGRRLVGVLLVLDTDQVAVRLRDNRALAAEAFPRRAPDIAALILGAAPVAVAAGGRALAAIDPLSRRRAWLRATSIDGRRTGSPYRDYADIARRMAG